MRIIDKIAWIEIKEQKILSARSKGKSIFYLPGGKREPGETDEETLIREIQEELDVSLLPDSLEFVGHFEAQAHGHAEGVMVSMRCYSGTFEGALKVSSEIEEMAWLDSSNMDIISPVDQIIFQWLKDRNQIK